MRDKKGRFVKGHKTPEEWKEKWRKKDCWQRGKERYNWKGRVISNGYVFHNLEGKYIREHHKVWIVANQCLVPQGHVIHHINEDKLDNRIENLECLSRAEHLILHNPLEARWS